MCAIQTLLLWIQGKKGLRMAIKAFSLNDIQFLKRTTENEWERGTIFSSLYASLVDVINLSHNNHKESLLGARLKWNCLYEFSHTHVLAHSAPSRYGLMLLLMMMLSSHNNMECENFSTVYLPTDSEWTEVCYLLHICVSSDTNLSFSLIFGQLKFNILRLL